MPRQVLLGGLIGLLLLLASLCTTDARLHHHRRRRSNKFSSIATNAQVDLLASVVVSASEATPTDTGLKYEGEGWNDFRQYFPNLVVSLGDDTTISMKWDSPADDTLVLPEYSVLRVVLLDEKDQIETYGIFKKALDFSYPLLKVSSSNLAKFKKLLSKTEMSSVVEKPWFNVEYSDFQENGSCSTNLVNDKVIFGFGSTVREFWQKNLHNKSKKVMLQLYAFAQKSS
eukprot:gnl/Spiro4/25265_TR12579_c0_g1_i1.p1 gnl/Spiro4/25265_TR12579_c0_g1~~gnl/Spiro4/25265_TR12579_c0_g1_i1.p1  ORF type:complete len:237 (-),score=48.10 gnl/Spiro4/25265_TR12579_c0_g1_i1:49-732(-)